MRWKLSFLLLSFVISILLYSNGLYQLVSRDNSYQNSWTPTGLILFLLLVALLSHFATKKLSSKGGEYGFIFAILFLTIIYDRLDPLLHSLFLLYSSYALGDGIKRTLLKIDNKDFTLSVATGLAVYGVLVNYLALVKINYYAVYFVILLVPIIWQRKNLNFYSCDYSYKNKYVYSTSILITFILLMYFSNALMPEIGWDALVSHLYIPNYLDYNKKWNFDFEHYTWAGAYLGDWIYALAYILGNEYCARIVNFSFLLLLCCSSIKLLRLFIDSRFAELLLILLLISTPVFYLENSSLYIDAIWCFLIVECIYLIVTTQSLSAAYSVQLGILLGAAISAKLISLLFIPALLVIYVLNNKYLSCKQFLKNVVLTLFFVAIFSSGTLFINYWYTGNPVFPFYNNIFKSPLFPLEAFNNNLYNWPVTIYTVFDLTFNSAKYLESKDGGAGFTFLMFTLPAFIFLLLDKGTRLRNMFFIAVASFIFVFLVQSYIRYILPVYILFNVIVVYMVYESSSKGGLIRFSAIALFVICIFSNLIFLKSATHYGTLDFRTLVSEKYRDEYLAKMLPIRLAVNLVNAMKPSDEDNVLLYSSPYGGTLNNRALLAAWYDGRFNERLSALKSQHQLVELFNKNKIKFIVIDLNFGNEAIRDLIIGNTFLIKSFNGVEVREYIPQKVLGSEILIGPDLKNNSGWFHNLDKNKITYPALSTIDSFFYQPVKLNENSEYIAVVNASCIGDAKGQGRVQVNLLSSEGSIIDSKIKVFDCTSDVGSYKMIFSSPEKVVSGIFYLGGHDKGGVAFYSASLKMLN